MRYLFITGGDGVDSAAFWSKGCHMCRRRTTETNQLSTVSRPRAELLGTSSAKASENLKGTSQHIIHVIITCVCTYVCTVFYVHSS